MVRYVFAQNIEAGLDLAAQAFLEGDDALQIDATRKEVKTLQDLQLVPGRLRTQRWRGMKPSSLPVMHKVDNFVPSSSNENILEVVN